MMTNSSNCFALSSQSLSVIEYIVNYLAKHDEHPSNITPPDVALKDTKHTRHTTDLSVKTAQSITASLVSQCQALPTRWVTEQSDLNDLVHLIDTRDWAALDTEFIKRTTYYPRLALVQLNMGDVIYLVDAPKLDLSQFWEALSDLPMMIWHACGEDLGIFYLLADVPVLTNVFDTQIALSFLGRQMQMGYQQAVARELDIALDKAHSQSDWLARPLSHEQEQYAADDVRYLPVLFDALVRQLHQKNLLDAVWQDCQNYAQSLYDQATMEDDAAYHGMADFRYSSKQMAILQAVCAWRESLARATNQPRTFILSKQAVRDLVTNPPTSRKALTHLSVDRQIIHTYGDELLDIIKRAKQLEPTAQPAKIVPPYRSKDKALSRAVKKLVADWEAQTGIPAQVLMRKKWLADVYAVVAFDSPLTADWAALPDVDKQDVLNKMPNYLQGWRLSWVTTALLPLLFEHQAHLLETMGASNV